MDFITGLPSCANGCNAIFYLNRSFDKIHCFDHMYFRGRGVECQTSCTVVFLGCCQDSLACLTMWFIIETHNLLQSSGLNFGTPLDLGQSLVVLTIPKLMVR